MKLKKIASLALAGIMAVSMLAGCGEGISNSGSSSSENTNTVTGYSASVQAKLSNTAQKKVALSDSADLNSALQAAMEYVANSNIAKWYDASSVASVKQVVDNSASVYASNDQLVSAAQHLINTMDAENTVYNNVFAALTSTLNPTDTNYNEKELNATFLFVVDGGKGANAVMKEVADLMNSGIEALNEHYEDAANNVRADYEYTGSVSAYTKTLTEDHGKSVAFIAVNVAREIV